MFTATIRSCVLICVLLTFLAGTAKADGGVGVTTPTITHKAVPFGMGTDTVKSDVIVITSTEDYWQYTVFVDGLNKGSYWCDFGVYQFEANVLHSASHTIRVVLQRWDSQYAMWIVEDQDCKTVTHP